MYSYEYSLPLTGTGLSIASYDLRPTDCRRSVREAPPIKMTISTCTSKSGPISVLSAIRLDNSKSKDFIAHYQEIFTGPYGAWKLTCVRIDADVACFFYHNTESCEAGCIALSLNETKIDNLDIYLEVPHPDPHSPRKCTLRMARTPQDAFYHTFATIHLPDRQRMFYFSSGDLDEFSITEYYDL